MTRYFYPAGCILSHSLLISILTNKRFVSRSGWTLSPPSPAPAAITEDVLLGLAPFAGLLLCPDRSGNSPDAIHKIIYANGQPHSDHITSGRSTHTEGNHNPDEVHEKII